MRLMSAMGMVLLGLGCGASEDVGNTANNVCIHAGDAERCADQGCQWVPCPDGSQCVQEGFCTAHDASCAANADQPSCVGDGCQWNPCPPNALCGPDWQYCRVPDPLPPTPRCEALSDQNDCEQAGCDWTDCGGQCPADVSPCRPPAAACGQHQDWSACIGANCDWNPCPPNATCGPDYEACQATTPCFASGDSDCDVYDGFCGRTPDNAPVCRKWRDIGERCGGIIPAHFLGDCRPGLECDYTGVPADDFGYCRQP